MHAPFDLAALLKASRLDDACEMVRGLPQPPSKAWFSKSWFLAAMKTDAATQSPEAVLAFFETLHEKKFTTINGFQQLSPALGKAVEKAHPTLALWLARHLAPLVPKLYPFQQGELIQQAAPMSSVLDVLLDAGVPIDARARDEKTTLMRCVEQGYTHASQLSYLLYKGADPNQTDVRGWTALQRACKVGHAGTVEMFLEHGADPNAVNPEGLTPLMIAARRPVRDRPPGLEDSVDVLCRYGADPLALAPHTKQRLDETCIPERVAQIRQHMARAQEVKLLNATPRAPSGHKSGPRL